MNDCCAAANIPPLFSGGVLSSDAMKDIWPHFKTAFQPDIRGTRSEDLVSLADAAHVQVCFDKSPRSHSKEWDDIMAQAQAQLSCASRGTIFSHRMICIT